MLRLKLQYFGHLMRRDDLLWKTLMLGGIGGRRRRGRQRMRWLDGITDSMDMSWVISRGWWWTGSPGVLRFMGSQRVGHNWATEMNWTEGGRGWKLCKNRERSKIQSNVLWNELSKGIYENCMDGWITWLGLLRSNSIWQEPPNKPRWLKWKYLGEWTYNCFKRINLQCHSFKYTEWLHSL